MGRKPSAKQAVLVADALRDVQAREAAMRKILQVISLSRADQKPVFDVILENAARLCGSPGASLEMVQENGSGFVLAASWGESLLSFEVGQAYEMDSTLVVPRAVSGKRVVQVEDAADDDLYRKRDPIRVQMVEEEGIRTLLAVPLVREEKAIGTISLYRREVAPFSDDEIGLVQTFAEQAIIAIENVRQFRELEVRFEREAATRQILQVISQSRADERPVFDVILESASRLCAAPLALLSIVNEDMTHVIVPAHRGVRPEFARALEEFCEPLETSELVAVRAISECGVIRSANLMEDNRYESKSRWRHELVGVEGVRSILVVPLIADDRGIGAIILYRREVKPFSADDVTLVESFAAQAVIAVQNVKQFRALETRTLEVQTLNESLVSRVEEQVGEIERMGRLKRFLSPQVADAVVSSGDDTLLSSHRALIASLFCDIRGFTAFCETAEPEETIEVLQTYHEEMGKLLSEHGAGVDHRMGDGIMVIFNDPLPCDDPAGDALRLGLAMRDRMAELGRQWRKLGHRLGFGVGISLGYATVGMVGSEGRYDYTANGTAVNLAARLCDQAEDGEILLSPRAYTAVEGFVEVDSYGELSLKGINAPVEVFRVTGLKLAV